MKVPETSETSFDLCWRMFGVPIRIHPFFWVSSALLGLRYYLDPEAGSLGYFVFWMAAVLMSVLAHQFGQIVVGRLFGMRGEVVLSGLGGRTLGLAALPRRWQRVVVLLAGPLVNGLLAVGVVGLTWIPFPATLLEWGWGNTIATGAFILFRINCYWALVNVLPLWPLDGGLVVCEIGEGLFGQLSLVVSLVLSLLVAGLFAAWVTDQMSRLTALRYDPRYSLYLVQLGLLLLYCFVFWLLNFLALWPAKQESASPKANS